MYLPQPIVPFATIGSLLCGQCHGVLHHRRHIARIIAELDIDRGGCSPRDIPTLRRRKRLPDRAGESSLIADQHIAYPAHIILRREPQGDCRGAGLRTSAPVSGNQGQIKALGRPAGLAAGADDPLSTAGTTFRCNVLRLRLISTLPNGGVTSKIMSSCTALATLPWASR